MNDKVYIHEFIDIIGHNRARYMHHMTANFSPAAQEDRAQRCYGVWGVVGSTGRWPQVVNIWEEEGLDGLASSFRHELGHASLQDPKLAKWWAEAAHFRSGGTDRLLAPAPWSRTIEQLCASEVGGETYAHEQVTVPRGTAHQYLDVVSQDATPVFGHFGWELAGAWETLMGDDSECFFLWAVPTWDRWAEVEQARRTHPPLARWRQRVLDETTSFSRILLVDAPLCPFRIHRQPAYSDRTDWVD